MKLYGFCRLAAVCGWAAFSTFAQSTPAPAEKKLSARELFYAPPSAAAATIKTVSQETTIPPRTTPAAGSKSTPRIKTPTTTGRRTTQPRLDNMAAGSTEAPIDRATTLTAMTPSTTSPVTEAVVPLGLRYSILKRDEGNRFNEVDPDTTFHSGDRMRIRVEANDTGYLYILHRGSSKTWSVMFPNADTAQGDNRVQRGKQYDMPAGANLVFDDQPGTERLFVILSRKPEPDLERLIYKLSTDGGSSTPVATPSEPKAPAKLLASNLDHVDDSLIARVRTANLTLSRDLIFEKVDDSTAAADNKERAVYVVNPATSDQARLIVDMSVQHK